MGLAQYPPNSVLTLRRLTALL